MEYEVVPRIFFNKRRCELIGEFFYNPADDSIILDHPFVFPVQLAVLGLERVFITPWFKRFPTIFRANININLLCRELDLIAAVDKNKLLIHGSCVARGREAKLFVGFPNSGKTYQTFKHLREGWTLISEEITVINNGVASAYRKVMRSCLSNRTIRDCRIKITDAQRLQLAVNTLRAKCLPFLYEDAIWKDSIPSGKSARVTEIISCGKRLEDHKQLVYLTENEFPIACEAILECYAYASGFDLAGVQDKQRQLIKEFFKGVHYA